MRKKVVRKVTFDIWNVLFHICCVSGLIWQITQISVQYFAFDVIKSVNIFMPEEVMNEETIVNVCFKNSEIIDRDKHPNYDGRRYSIREKFEITTNSSEMFKRIGNGKSTRISEFIFGRVYCYEAVNIYHSIPISNLLNVSIIFASRDQGLPRLDVRRLYSVTDIGEWANKTYFLTITSYSYIMYKLKTPYVDRCVDYSEYNFADKTDAIIKCVNEKLSKRTNYRYYGTIFFKENASSYENTFTYETPDQSAEEEKECKEQYSAFDCHRHFFQTELVFKKFDLDPEQGNNLILTSGWDREASTMIESKARVNMIDFVTFVLGALGSWLGFSFVAINPVVFFLEYNNDACPKIAGNSRIQNRILILEFRNKVAEKRIQALSKRGRRS